MTLTERASALYVFMAALNRHDEHTDALAGFGARDDLNAALSHAEALRAALQLAPSAPREAGDVSMAEACGCPAKRGEPCPLSETECAGRIGRFMAGAAWKLGEAGAQQPPSPLPVAASPDTRRDCTCLGTCKGPEGLGPRWRCVMGREKPAPVTASEPKDAR
jgi:hypothetical protein